MAQEYYVNQHSRDCQYQYCFDKSPNICYSCRGHGLLRVFIVFKVSMFLGSIEHILKNKFATEDELASIDADVKKRVQECADFAESSPYPETSLMYDAVYEQKDYPFIAHKL